MLRRATPLLFLLLFSLAVGTALAQQEVTIRELNALPQETIDQLNAIGEDPDGLIPTLIQPPLFGEEVVITAVVLTDPLDSGLSSWDAARGGPNRIHVFVRDVAAGDEGPEGMNMQIVDGDYDNTGLINVVVGDVLRMTGSLSAFGTAMQFSPTTVEPLGSYTDFGLDDSIFDPVVVTTSDLNMMMAPQKVQVNWDNYPTLIHQKIRIENATILRRTLADAGRPNWNLSSDAGETFTQNDDVSLRFRNDRIGVYTAPFNVRDASDPFQPPPVGSVVNVEGYVLFRGAFEAFDFGGIPPGQFLQIAPFDDLELEVTELPNVRTISVAALDFVPGADPVPVSLTVDADAGAVAGVTLAYTTSTGASGSVDLADQGDGSYAGEIPAQADGAFVTYSVTVTNTDGIEFEPGNNEFSYRVLVDGINEIEDVQLTADGGEGGSPFDGITTAMDITATVHSDPSSSGFIAIQDGIADPWECILIRATEELIADLQQGDVINITEAQIEENFDVTRLRDITYTTVDEQGGGIFINVLETDDLQDVSIAEGFEGCPIAFENVLIVNPDEGFGEWSYATVNADGTFQASALADDASDGISSSFAVDTFAGGEILEFIQGIWWFSFGDFKLIPETPDDVGMVTNVAVEGEELPGRFALEQNYPNPFNPATTIRYHVASQTRVTLTVFDVLGRRVVTLLDQQQAPGTYDVVFEADNLPSGLYLYRLEAGASVQTKRMLLLK